MPKLKVEEIKATSVSTAIPLYYDSGVLYDDSDAHYDLMYPYDADMAQGEVPKIMVHPEEKITITETENVIIKETKRGTTW